MTTPWTPFPVPGPQTPAHTPTPAQYTAGAVRRHTTTRAVAVRSSLPSSDGTLDWAVQTVDYGGYYAAWDDVNTGWVDVHPAFLGGGGTLTVGVVFYEVSHAPFSGGGTLEASVNYSYPQLGGTGVLSATAHP